MVRLSSVLFTRELFSVNNSTGSGLDYESRSKELANKCRKLVGSLLVVLKGYGKTLGDIL